MGAVFKRLLYFFTIIIVFEPTILFGYLDPGTFSYIASLLVGVIVGSIVYMKAIWYKIKSYLKKNKSK